MPNPYEIDIRTGESAAALSGSADDPVLPCHHWVRVEARYADRWRTPMAGAEFRLYINDVVVLEKERLKDYEQVVGLTRGSPPSTEAERKVYEELGTFLHRSCEPGNARAEIIYDPGLESEITDMRDAIEARLDGAYRALKEKMLPYQAQWDRWGYLSIPMAQAQGLAESAGEWAVGLGDLFTAKYWSEIGEGISNIFWATVDKLEAAGESAAKLGQEIYENRDKMVDGSWWTQKAEQAARGVQQSAQDLADALLDGAAALDRTAEAAKRIFKHRDSILALPDRIVAGDVDAIEHFIDTALEDIDPKMAKSLRYDSTWQASIELLHDGETAGTVVVYLDLFLTVAPPNFWSHAVGRIGFYIMIEVVLLVIGILLGGAGAAARIALISARLTRFTATAGRAGHMADKALDAARAAIRMLDAFKDSVRDLDRLKDRLLKSRRRTVTRGKTKNTLRKRRDTEERDGRCRVCGSRTHNTPIHRHGQVDYV